MAKIFIDFETRSRVDLRKTGATFYARDPSTEPICCAICRDDGPVDVLAWPKNHTCPYDSDNDIVIAHNVGFEKNIIRYCIPDWPDPKNWIDTSAMCRLAGLPGGLGESCEILKLSAQKDRHGKNLIEKLCKPNKNGVFIESPELLAELYAYCAQDVTAMRDLYNTLFPFTKSEYKIWSINRKLNENGLLIDRDLVVAASQITEIETQDAITELTQITNGRITSPSQVGRIAEFCGMSGEGVSAKSIAENIKRVNPVQRRVLEIRQSVGKSSTAKLQAILDRLDSDNRIRDLLIYHGASTGRETGSGPQPLNFPRGKLVKKGENHDEKIENVVNLIKLGERGVLTDTYGSALNAISYSLRSAIIAENEFLCADLNAIEARLVFWFAGENEALDAYRADRDIYRVMASRIYNKSIQDVSDGERFVGKTAILGLGYGMGARKFEQTCDGYGIKIEQSEAQHAVDTYRRTYRGVVSLWGKLERAVRSCIKTKKLINLGHLQIKIVERGQNRWLVIRLPSGRHLRYLDPRIDDLGKISYRGIDKGHFAKINTFGGKILENIVQATSRDLLWFLLDNLIKNGYNPVLTVYDEILCDNADKSLKDMIDIMKRPPDFLPGLPLSAEGWRGKRYRKG